MKKRSVLALLLAVLMILSLFSGCGKKEAQGGTVTPLEDSAKPTEQREVSLGRMEGGKYTNSYAGYGCTLDSSWLFRTAEELQALPENLQEMFSGSEVGELMAADYPQISDMVAENAAQLSTINVLYTQIPLTEQIAYAAMSEEEIIDATLQNQDMMIEGYEQAGVSVISMEKVFVPFLGQERAAIKTVSTVQGMDYYILQIYDFGWGSYGVTLTLSSFLEDNTGNMLELFYPVD